MKLFTYPQAFKTLPEHRTHSGQQVEVLRELTSQEYDGPEHGEERMFRVRAADGWEGDVFESELS